MIGTQFHICGQGPGVVTIIPTEGTFHRSGRELPYPKGSELRSTVVNIMSPSCFSKNKKISIYISFFYLTGPLGNTLDLLSS